MLYTFALGKLSCNNFDTLTSLNLLSLNFNKYRFAILSSVLNYLYDFKKELKHLLLYLKIVDQV